MPPQFFKDASSGSISNKFKPRMFAFSFGNSDNHASPLSDSSSHELSDPSGELAKSSSTAATSINGSRFFISSKNTNKSSNVKHFKESSPQNDQYQEDFILSDSSIDNMELLVRNLKVEHAAKDQSTPTKHHKTAEPIHTLDVLQPSQCVTRSKHQRTSNHKQNEQKPTQTKIQHQLQDHGEEGIEIVDIRDVSNGDVSASRSFQHQHLNSQDASMSYRATAGSGESHVYFQRGEESNDNYLLEALSKSQNMCNVFKQQLHSSNTKIAYQDDKIAKQESKLKELKQMISKFQRDLSKLHSETQEIRQSKCDENEVIKKVKAECDELQKNLNVHKTEVTDAKKKVDHLKQIKQASTYEITKKNLEITGLQQKLDETSGFLSEQKIKTSDFEKNLEKSRKDYDKKIQNQVHQYKDLETKLEAVLNSGIKSIDSGITTCFKQDITLLIQNNTIDTNSKLNSLSERFMSALTLSNSNVSKEVTKISDLIGSKIDKNQNNMNQLISNSESSRNKEQKRFENDIACILNYLKSFTDSLKLIKTHLSKGSESLISKITESIETLGKEIRDQNISKLELTKCKEINNLLKGEADNIKLLITKKDETIKNLENDIIKYTNNVKSLEIEKEVNLSKIEFLNNQVASKNMENKSVDEKLEKSKQSYETKLRSQQEIYMIITQELEQVKNQLAHNQEQLKEHNSVKDKLKLLQLRLKELDFIDKDSKSLKTKLEQFESKERDIKALEAELKQVKNKFKRSEDLHSDLIKQIKNLESKELELLTQLSRLEIENSDLTHKITALHEQLALRGSSSMITEDNEKVPTSEQSINDSENSNQTSRSFCDEIRKPNPSPNKANIISNSTPVKISTPEANSNRSESTRPKDVEVASKSIKNPPGISKQKSPVQKVTKIQPNKKKTAENLSKADPVDILTNINNSKPKPRPTLADLKKTANVDISALRFDTKVTPKTNKRNKKATQDDENGPQDLLDVFDFDDFDHASPPMKIMKKTWKRGE